MTGVETEERKKNIRKERREIVTSNLIIGIRDTIITKNR